MYKFTIIGISFRNSINNPSPINQIPVFSILRLLLSCTVKMLLVEIKRFRNKVLFLEKSGQMQRGIRLGIVNSEFLGKRVIRFQVGLSVIDAVDYHLSFCNLRVGFHLLSFGFLKYQNLSNKIQISKKYSLFSPNISIFLISPYFPLSMNYGIILQTANFQILDLILNALLILTHLLIQQSHLVTNTALSLHFPHLLRHSQTLVVIFDGQRDVLVLLRFVGRGDFVVQFDQFSRDHQSRLFKAFFQALEGDKGGGFI